MMVAFVNSSLAVMMHKTKPVNTLAYNGKGSQTSTPN